MRNLLTTSVLVACLLAAATVRAGEMHDAHVYDEEPPHLGDDAPLADHLLHPGKDTHHDIYGDGLSEEKAVCNVCADIVVPALDEAIAKSKADEHWRDFVEDVIHALPQKYRYDVENHAVVEHDDSKHGTEPCTIVSEQVHSLTFDPHTHASIAALGHMYHDDTRVKKHLKRMATHIMCSCHDDVTSEDGEFHDLMQMHVHETDRLQHKYDLHHEEYEHGAKSHGHLSEPKEETRELTKQELEEMEWQEDKERHEAMEHGDNHHQKGQFQGAPDEDRVHGDQGEDPQGAPRGGNQQDLDLEGLGIGIDEL